MATPTERRVAELCLDVLGNVRRELDFYRRLQTIYSTVADAPPEMDPESVRRLSLEAFRELFEDTHYRIAGRELLPAERGQIFIMNHLVNHPDNLLPNDFILTLDTLRGQHDPSGGVRRGAHPGSPQVPT